jgi:hypothetical protein
MADDLGARTFFVRGEAPGKERKGVPNVLHKFISWRKKNRYFLALATNVLDL